MSKFTKWLEHRFNPMEDPSKPMAAAAINSVFGWLLGGANTASGEVINEYSALKHVTVYSCVRVLSEAVGSLTLRTYKRLGKGRTEAAEDPLWKLLALTPNDEMPASVLWENAVGCLALTGNSYIEILRNKSRQPVQIYPLHALKTEPVRLPSGVLAYRTRSGMQDSQSRIIDAEDVLHFRLFSWDGLVGLSPIQQAAQSIGWSTAAIKQSARFFGQGSTPPGILTPVSKVDEQDLVNMRKFWELSNAGENHGRTGVLPSDWKYTQLGISAKDAQFLESMQFSRTDIASLFRVPAHYVGDTTRMSNNNVEGMNLSFVIDTLRPYLVKIEQELQIKLLEGDTSRFVEFDTSDRLRGDFKTTMDAFAVGRQWGILTANDCREQIGMNPLAGPEGNLTWAPVNMQDSTRMLTTESIQDQPVGAPEPNAQEPDTQARNLFKIYGPSFLSIYKDAVGRASARSKRDAETITPILTPVLRSMTEAIESEARSQFRLADSWHASDKIQRDFIKSAASRAADWKPEEKGQIAGDELAKAFRTLYYAIYREAGAALAEKELEHAQAA
jgi:HK97 family phage portal protein